MSEDCHDSNNLVCEYCDGPHHVSECPHLAKHREHQQEQDMAAEAAYYDIPGAAESF